MLIVDEPIGFYGFGHYLPPRKVSNEEIIKTNQLKLKSYFIKKRIGIESRFFADENSATSDLAVESARQALENANISIEKISRLILATVSGDYITPSTACVVQRKLGGKDFPAVDMMNACSGFIYALDYGIKCAMTGDRYVLVIGADSRSKQLNMEDKRTAFLYGDGAGAVIIGSMTAEQTKENPDFGVLNTILFADGIGSESVYIPCGGSKEAITLENLQQKRNKITMPNGKIVAQNALQGFANLSRKIVQESGYLLEDVNFFIFHQANYRLLQAVINELNIPECKTHINFPTYGNTSSATVPIAMSEAYHQGKIQKGDLVLLCAVGAGYTGGAVLVRWNI